MLTQNRCHSTCQYPGRFSQQPHNVWSVHFTFMFFAWLPTFYARTPRPFTGPEPVILSEQHNILMTLTHKTADTSLSLAPAPLHTCAEFITADIQTCCSDPCGSSGPGCGYIAPSTIRLTSVWTQTCINLQEDKLQALASSRVYIDIFISNLLRELLQRDGSRMQ